MDAPKFTWDRLVFGAILIMLWAPIIWLLLQPFFALDDKLSKDDEDDS